MDWNEAMISWRTLVPALLLAALIVAASGEATDRVAAARANKGAAVKKLVADAGLAYPPEQVLIRAYKQEAEVEVWARGKDSAKFIKLKTYPICYSSGQIGPKRVEGDGQVPEGIYRVNLFNPASSYHLSLGIDYPNRADLARAGNRKPGGEIFIHGNCVSIGCIPIEDDPIEEVYLLALDSKNSGRDPAVHIFPCRLDQKACQDTLASLASDPSSDPQLWQDLTAIHAAFDANHQLPAVTISAQGRYTIKK
jgi:murein L,D-transpeptidase YafK